MSATETVFLPHNKVTLALHRIKDGTGRPLMLLHGLGEDASRMGTFDVTWAGPVWALDFTGHGQSTVPMGGGYSCEILMADVDVALRHIGECTVLGRGIGGYVAFLIAGARPALVRGAVITDGPGLAGGPVHVSSTTEIAATVRTGSAPDPWAMIELSRDARPANYALTFLRWGGLAGIDPDTLPAYKAFAEKIAAAPAVAAAMAREGIVLDTYKKP